MTGEPTTACQTGGLRARHRPRTASRAFDGAIHTEAWPGPVATKQSAARGGLGDCRSYSWSWARPRCAGRWLTRGGAAKRGLPRATMKPPRCGSERLRAFVHNGFAIGDRPCETVHPWNKYRNRDQGGLSCPFTSPRWMFDVRCSSGIQHWMFDVECSSGIQRWMFDVRCWMFVRHSASDVRCWMFDVRPALSVGCSMFNVRCSMFVRCSMLGVRLAHSAFRFRSWNHVGEAEILSQVRPILRTA